MRVNYILYSAFLIGIMFLTTSSNAEPTRFTPQQITQIQQTIHDYLIKNPEILLEVSAALQQKQLVTAIKRTETAIPKYFTQIFKSNKRPVIGNLTGKVTLVEFFDYQCPHCEVMVPIISKLIAANPDLKVIFIEWPIFGDDSQYAARAAIASMEQNRYYPFHTAMLKKDYPLNKEDVLALAKSVGINIKRLEQNMQNRAINDQIKSNSKLAQNINIVPPLGTPVFIVGIPKTHKFRLIVGQTDQKTLQKAIDEIKRGHT